MVKVNICVTALFPSSLEYQNIGLRTRMCVVVPLDNHHNLFSSSA
jgi:hypothetical protein